MKPTPSAVDRPPEYVACPAPSDGAPQRYRMPLWRPFATRPRAPTLTLRERRHAIGAILDARFSVRAFQKVQREDPGYWSSPRNDMARGIYGEAMREKQRLARATDAQLLAEIASAGA
jgi:hypothetical protein